MCLTNENIIHIKKNDIEILKFKKLEEHENIVHAFCLKPLNFRNREGINNDYKVLMESLDLKYESLVKLWQTHTDNILVLDKKVNENTADIGLDYLKDVDAAITNKPQITIATTCADCLCILLYDNKKGVIGNVHSGWRGTFKKIAQKTVVKMIETYNCNPEDISVFLAPSIRKCCFEVDADVMEMCAQIFSYLGVNEKIITEGDMKEGKQKYYIDTLLINKLLLKEVGILESNIFDSQICSFCGSGKIHSRRADGDGYGLGTAVIMMK